MSVVTTHFELNSVRCSSWSIPLEIIILSILTHPGSGCVSAVVSSILLGAASFHARCVRFANCRPSETTSAGTSDTSQAPATACQRCHWNIARSQLLEQRTSEESSLCALRRDRQKNDATHPGKEFSTTPYTTLFWPLMNVHPACHGNELFIFWALESHLAKGNQTEFHVLLLFFTGSINVTSSKLLG